MCDTACFVNDCKKVKNLNLIRTDARPLLEEGDATSVDGPGATFISPDGSKIYIVISASDPLITNTIVEFGVNVDGKIFITSTMLSDPAFPISTDGSPNPCFTQFTILDRDLDAGLGRIRLINESGALLASRIFTDLSTVSVLFRGGTFSHDGQYIAVLYTLTGSTETQNNSVIRILRAEAPDLPVVASYYFTGISIEPLWFTTAEHKSQQQQVGLVKTVEERYFISYVEETLAFVSGKGIIPVCPESLVVLQFLPLDNTIGEIDRAPLPALGVGLAVWPSKPCEIAYAKKHGMNCQALIATNGVIAINQFEVNPFVNPTNTPSCLETDSAEVRLYGFDGKKITILAAQNTDLTGRAIAFSPDARFLLYQAFPSLTRAVPFLTICELPDTLDWKRPLPDIKISRDESKAIIVDNCTDKANGLSIVECKSKDSKEQDKNCLKLIKEFKATNLTLENRGFISNGEPSTNNCLKIVRNKNLIPESFYMIFSMDYEWLIIGGLGIGGVSANEIQGLQLFKVVNGTC